MLASTVFFLVERDRVAGKWKTSLTVAALVTGVAFFFFFLALFIYERCMGYIFASFRKVVLLLYIDISIELITVPLQIVEFYLILAAVTNVKPSLFWKAF